MEKEVTTRVTVCDLCKNECEPASFYLPIMTYDPDAAKTDGSSVIVCKTKNLLRTDKSVDLCSECQNKIAHIIPYIPFAQISEDGDIDFSFKFENK